MGSAALRASVRSLLISINYLNYRLKKPCVKYSPPFFKGGWGGSPNIQPIPTQVQGFRLQNYLTTEEGKLLTLATNPCHQGAE
jgi:hypothetical protein